MERKRRIHLPHRTRRRLAVRGTTRSILLAIIVVVSRQILHSHQPWSVTDGYIILQHASSSAMGRDPLAQIVRNVFQPIMVQFDRRVQFAHLIHFHVAVDRPSTSNSSSASTPSPTHLGHSLGRYPGHVRAPRQRQRFLRSHFGWIMAVAQVRVRANRALLVALWCTRLPR